MYTGILHTHTLAVMLFVLIYVIKLFFLMTNKIDALHKFSGKIMIPEMIISTLFLLTGIYLAVYTGNKGSWLWVKLGVVAVSIPLAIVGFKKMSKPLAILSVLLIVYAYGISETKSTSFSSPKAEDEFSNTPPEKLGEAIFQSRCSACHGTDGKAGLSGAKDLTEATLVHEEVIKTINEGKNAMKGFSKQLSVEQIEAVAAYVESVRGH